MNNSKEKILREYDNNYELYESFTLRLESLLSELIESQNTIAHQITSRTKDRESLAEKLSRKNNKYSELSEITDLCGIRIITYYEIDVDELAKLIEDEFLIDPVNSIDKRKIETDKFGYRSLHYVIQLKKPRNQLVEYKKFKNLKVEIQIRSILQHAWAEIEHDIGYKGEIEIPDVARRAFYRISALLETVDLEFNQLKELLNNYETSLPLRLKSNPENVTIDKASLIEFVQNNDLVSRIELKIAELFDNTKVVDELAAIDLILPRLAFLKIESIKQLEDLIRENETKLPQYVRAFTDYDPFGGSGIQTGWSIFMLTYLLGSATEKSIEDFVKAFINTDSYENIMRRMLNAKYSSE